MNSRVDVQHGGESEGDGLTTSSLRDSDNIATAEGHWPRLTLDGRRRRKALRADSGLDVLREANLFERGDRTGNVPALNL